MSDESSFASAFVGFGEMGQDSWDMAASQAMQLHQLHFERQKYEDMIRRYGQEKAEQLLMAREDLSMKQKQTILTTATTQSGLASQFQARNQAGAANRQAISDRNATDKLKQNLSVGILSGMSGKRTGGSGNNKRSAGTPVSAVFEGK